MIFYKVKSQMKTENQKKIQSIFAQNMCDS